MIIYHDDLRFHADEWTPLHALHSSQKGTINLRPISFSFKFLKIQLYTVVPCNYATPSYAILAATLF